MKTNSEAGYLIMTFIHSEEFEQWLTEHHQKAGGVWLKIFKKAANKNGITRIRRPQKGPFPQTESHGLVMWLPLLSIWDQG